MKDDSWRPTVANGNQSILPLLCIISDLYCSSGIPWTCLHCNDFVTKDLANLVQHCKLCPHMPRPDPFKCKFVCYQCNYSSYHVVPFKGHIFQHMGARPFKCRVCPFATTQKSNVSTHMRNVHQIYWHRSNHTKYNLGVLTVVFFEFIFKISNFIIIFMTAGRVPRKFEKVTQVKTWLIWNIVVTMWRSILLYNGIKKHFFVKIICFNSILTITDMDHSLNFC